MSTNSFYDAKWRESGEFRPKIVAYYYKQWEDFHMGFHQHDWAEFMYVISGNCTVETNKDVIAMRKGDLIMLDAGVPHRLIVESGSPCRMLNVEFGFQPCEGIYPSMNQLSTHNPMFAKLMEQRLDTIVLRDYEDIQVNLRNLVFELDLGGEGAERGREMMTNLLMSQLLVRVARLVAVESKNSAERQIHHYVRHATEYIHQYYDTAILAKDIAAAVNLHPVYLQRIFKSNMDKTINEYLVDLRIEKAKMLLARTDVPIIEIADHIGLNSRQYFSMLFKKMTGMSPAEYRNSKKSITSWTDYEVEIVDKI
ncbi:AraC family transcriptional regulator [Paenibacillus sp. YAF4_2]|uniref:AraC family transcriptional regulator n=1 Tax=Paenibacillus sp. YAF4_2 TaxID=3233085 RepID=UPI003F999290